MCRRGVHSVAGVSAFAGTSVVFCVTPIVGVPAFAGEPVILASLLLLLPFGGVLAVCLPGSKSVSVHTLLNY
jgi:hypothetical protein